MDIKAAFDTINQGRMLQVVSNLLDVVSHPRATRLRALCGADANG